ncbi:MAG: sialidase family protein [Lachnospiraceae bacterium]
MRTINLGEIVLDLPPQPEKNNPRNSEGAFLTLDTGEIIFVYSRFKGSNPADYATSDICLMRSHDDGRTFGEETTLLTCEQEHSVNIMSLSLLHMQNGDVGLFYLVRTNYTKLQMFLRRSQDGGRTWQERILCTPQEGFFVVNNDRVVRLANGRILIPAASHRTGYYEKDIRTDIYFDSRSEAVYFYSDDDGQSWQLSTDKCVMPYTSACYSGLQEPGVLELRPGILWSWARTDLGRQYEMYSLDNGNHWTTCQPSRFTSPNSPLSIKRDMQNHIYAIWNPIPEYNGRERYPAFLGGRTPYVIAVSCDNGQTFSEPAAFETDESSGYCYCAIHFTKEAMLLAYCAGSTQDGSCLVRLRIRRVPLSTLHTLITLK